MVGLLFNSDFVTLGLVAASQSSSGTTLVSVRAPFLKRVPVRTLHHPCRLRTVSSVQSLIWVTGPLSGCRFDRPLREVEGGEFYTIHQQNCDTGPPSSPARSAMMRGLFPTTLVKSHRGLRLERRAIWTQTGTLGCPCWPSGGRTRGR